MEHWWAAHLPFIGAPREAGVPIFLLFFPCPFTSSSFAAFTSFLFPFLVRFTYFILSSIWSLSVRIVPLCFQAGGRWMQPNRGLFFCGHFVLSVLLS